MYDVQGQDNGYFVRLGAATKEPAPPSHESYEPDEPRHRKRRVRFKLRPLTLIGLILVGWLAWAATTPGGVKERLHDISNKLQSVVDDATTDPGLKRAATFYNDQYERTGTYPNLSEQDMRDDPDAGWGVGVTIEYCNPHAIVLQSLTGGGTISRLLLNGKDLGDVHGEQPCPNDLTNPLPWKATDASGS
jgi:hypothetical protein